MKILIVLGFLLDSSLGSGYRHHLNSYPSPFYPSHLTPQSEFYTSRHPFLHSNNHLMLHQFHQSNSHPVPQTFHHSNSHPFLYPVPIQTSTPKPIIVVTPVPVFVTPDSLFNSQRETFSSSSSNSGTNLNNGQFGNNLLNGKVHSTSFTPTPSRFDNNSSDQFPNDQILSPYYHN
ncbi:SMAD1 [Lepeophtheirus salmonis]|uniref:SMAD1 n=2 Tax=Lepeophtheirus salmonis TaxID=72036 RepID=A0A7R8CKS8_LEPSM|nr:SMAD1 [Lepeophtheirus salmonis]CAF2851518.1 SMAD1 [Lepeophtheirus salmonis]